jgi:hypothetical protein
MMKIVILSIPRRICAVQAGKKLRGDTLNLPGLPAVSEEFDSICDAATGMKIYMSLRTSEAGEAISYTEVGDRRGRCAPSR